MAKICGIIDFGKDDGEIKDLIKSMTGSMKHKSWHKQHLFCERKIGMGHISIGQTNKEEQPIWNKNKTKCIVMAGKIFDYKGISSNETDAEFILDSYEKFGDKFVKDLNGIFSFALFDSEKNKLILANDRYGIRPLFYCVTNKKMIFASEIKAILKDKTVKRDVDWKAWGDFIYCGEIHGDNTFFKDISCLPNASVLTFENGKI